MTKELSTPDLREAIYWHEIAHRRLRLAVLAFAIGLIIGFITYMIVAMPPVWIDTLPADAYCGQP